MLAYIQKMVTEEDELVGKIKKLSKALENKDLHLDKTQKADIADQMKAMGDYLDILKKRIEYEKNLNP